MKKIYIQPQQEIHHLVYTNIIAASALSISEQYADDSEAETREEMSWIDIWSEGDNGTKDIW